MVGFCTISQVMDRFHKKHTLTEEKFIKELIDTYKSNVHFLVFANTSTQFRLSGRVWRDRVFMIEYQVKS